MTRRQEAIAKIKAEMQNILAKKTELENNLYKLQEQVAILEKEQAPNPDKVEDLLRFRD
tara:strand:- start:177 stop:353 length:177 start_codon:yes stop_codon:yes gene_type:complete